jgi:hypothetical protein
MDMAFEEIARAWLAALALAYAAMAGACGGFVENDSTIARRTFDAQGGALQLDAFSLTVPPHALVHVVTLSARHAPSDAPAGPAYFVEPGGAMFDSAAPAEVVIGYDTSAHPHPLEVFAATFDGAVWQPLPKPASLADDAGRVHGLTTRTGTFGVIQCLVGACPMHGVDGGAQD